MSKRIALGCAGLLGLLALTFAINGLVLAKGKSPRAGHVTAARPAEVLGETGSLSLVSFNVAKGFVYLGQGRFADNAGVRSRLDEIAALVRREQPDFLFLSEVAWEAGWHGVNQVTHLAQQTGLTNWVFGENFCFGFPGYRLISGNAILTRHGSLKALENPDLPGRRPFFVTKNNRRALVAEAMVDGRPLRLYALHNDSFVPTNNLAQVTWLLNHARQHRAIMAGDFNATPESPSMQAIRRSRRFAGEWAGPPTLPNVKPDRTIDYILGPAGWAVVRHRVLTNGASDHCAVATVFRIEAHRAPP